MASAPPPVVLDTTLRDLYAAEGDGDDITLAYAVPTAEVQMSAGIPLSRKFSYQSPACPTYDSDTLAREFLQLVPQLFGFVAGGMPLIIFDLDPDPAERGTTARRQHQADAHRVLDRLAPFQRPALTFVPFPAAIPLRPATRFAIVNPMDCLLPHPHLVHYTALSKRALALSSLPTPLTTVVDTVLGPAQAADAELLAFEAERMLAPSPRVPCPSPPSCPRPSPGRAPPSCTPRRTAPPHWTRCTRRTRTSTRAACCCRRWRRARRWRCRCS